MSAPPISPTQISLRDKEQAEVKAVLAALSRSPLVSRLFSHICRKYFEAATAQLNELRIAVEVFGRGENFDRSQDAIARVEAHRLRKRLKQYYETEGKDHEVRIELPAGSYIPVFHHVQYAPRMDEAANGGPLHSAKEAEPIAPQPPPGVQRRRRLRWYLAGAALLVAIIALVPTLPLSNGGNARPVARAAVATPSIPAVADTSAAVRLLCGYEGLPHIGRLGDRWNADGFFTGGGPWATRHGYIRRTNDPFLFQNTRTGQFAYDIPASSGIYELHLYFVETEYGEELGGGENSRTMRIVLNGATLFEAFDPLADAGGPRIADVRVFKDVSPAADGKVHLRFESRRGQPIVSAIELLPSTAHRQLPVRLVTQVNSYTDSAGQVWSPDNYYLGGQFFTDKPLVSDTRDPMMFTSERAGNFSYAIPVDVNGTYGVKLHFAETYFGPEASGIGGVGSRVFNVTSDGVTLLNHFDIYKEAGSLHPVVKTFHGLKPNPMGKLMLYFEPIANYASVFAIEVVDETK
jgi:hypothetical protein